ncbi:MAG: LapA family protein [Oscillatoriales cyanobacterium SM2_2_1]|nr:LapA family protein [Oscillatoriales cyanobacterium SM2_2_1]
MRQINFAAIFAIILALVLFALENTEFATIKIVPTVSVEAPLSVELIVAMGIGATLAWFFSVWSGIQGAIESGTKNRQIRNLEEKVSTLTVEVEERKRLLSASAIDVDVEERSK